MSKLKFKICIIGVDVSGISAFGNIIATRNDAQIAALCNPNPVRMEFAAKDLGFKPNFYISVKTMIAAKKLDAVVITNPDFCHNFNSVAALNNGGNVLIDKPPTTTVNGCQSIISATVPKTTFKIRRIL